MRFDDLLRVSLRQVFRQRRRNLGVVLAIALGTAGLVVVITTGQDVKENINNDLELLGGATRIKLTFDEHQQKYSILSGHWFYADTVKAIRQLPGVTDVAWCTFKTGIVIQADDGREFPLALLGGIDEFAKGK